MYVCYTFQGQQLTGVALISTQHRHSSTLSLSTFLCLLHFPRAEIHWGSTGQHTTQTHLNTPSTSLMLNLCVCLLHFPRAAARWGSPGQHITQTHLNTLPHAQPFCVCSTFCWQKFTTAALVNTDTEVFQPSPSCSTFECLLHFLPAEVHWSSSSKQGDRSISTLSLMLNLSVPAALSKARSSLK